MVTLANLRGADLVVDPVPAIQAIGQGVGDILTNRAEKTVFSQTSTAAQKREAFLRISKINPAFGKVVLNLLEKQEAFKLKQMEDQVEEQGTFSIALQRLPNHAARVKAIQDKQREAIVEGQDPSELGRMAEMDEDELNFKLSETALQAEDFKTIIKPPPPAQQVLQDGVPVAQIDPKSGLQVELPTATQEVNLPTLTAQLNNKVEKGEMTRVQADKMIRLKQAAESKGNFAFGGLLLTQDEKGNPQANVVIMNKDTGTAKAVQIGVDGKIVSRTTGLTPGETTTELTKRAGGVAGAQAAVELETAGPIKLEERRAEIETAPALAAGAKRGALKETRLQTNITIGLEFADKVPVLNRSLQLLREIDTGFFAGAKLRAAEFFGVEGADQAELSNNLAQSVLKQIRPVFGAQPSEREGRILIDISAGLGKSQAGNKRLIGNLLKLVMARVEKGQRSAAETGDTGALEDFDAILKLQLGPPPPVLTTEPTSAIQRATQAEQGRKIGRFTVREIK